MKKANYGLSLLMVLALVLMGLAPIFASPQEAAAGGSERQEGQLVEVFIEVEGVDGAALGGLSTDAVVSTLRAHASATQQPIIEFLEKHDDARVLNTFWLDNLILVTVDPNLIPVLFYRFPEIEDVFPNFEVTIPEPPEPFKAVSGEGGVNQASPPPTWGVNRIRAPEVWAEGIDGTGVRIAVLDTGVHIAHPDLAGRMWTDDPANREYPGGWIEFDSYGQPVVGSVPHDTGTHGTFCSAIALGGATGEYAIGVAPGAWLMHALMLPDGATWAQAIAGMQWAVAPHDDAGNPAGEPADVVSMSFGALAFIDATIEPIQNMIAAGIVPVAAIGNDGVGTSVSPGNVFEAFGIGATNVWDDVTWWSSGQMVDWPASHPYEYIVPDFAAPGSWSLSAIPPDGWTYAQGTSVAAPHVAGAVALMLQHRPHLTVDEIYELLRVTACELGDPGQDIRFGWGIIDAFDATFLDSGIQGVVTCYETGVPLAGVAVYVHDVDTFYTDAEGHYTAWLWPGEYTLTVSISGYEEETATVTVEEDAFTVHDFALIPILTGSIAGTVTDAETGEPIAGAVVTVLETSLYVVTDAAGTYTIEEVPIGTSDVHTAAEGYFPSIAYDVIVDEGVTTTVDFALNPSLAVAILGDWAGQLEALLDVRGHLAEPRGWNVVENMAYYDVVIVNRLYDPGEETFLNFLAEAGEHGVGLLFTSNRNFAWPWGIKLLQLHLGNPLTQCHDTHDGAVFYEVTMSHPIFAGWEVGEQVTIHENAWNHHAWFGAYSGITAANVGSVEEGVRGGGMAFSLFEGNAHLLLAGLGPRAFSGVHHWTDDGRTIFLRGVEWVADPLVEPPPFDFSLAVEPTAATITLGKEVTAAVTATLEAGTAENVSLAYTLPEGVAGITVTFEPTAGEPTFESAMSIAAATDATVGVHEITITGTAGDALVRTTTFTLTVVYPEYTIDLWPGWNLISMPLIPVDPAITVVLAGILDDVVILWHYDAETEDWKGFVPGASDPELTVMVDGKGFWINMAAATTLTVTGTEMPPPPASPPEYPVFEGWNHIGFTSTTAMTAQDYLGAAIVEIFVKMWAFDAEAVDWIPVGVGDYLQPGRGYWLAVSEDGIIFPEGELLE